MGLKVAVPCPWVSGAPLWPSRFHGGGHSVRLYFLAPPRMPSTSTCTGRTAGVAGSPAGQRVGHGDLAKAAAGADMIILAPSSAGLRHMCRQLMPLISAKKTVIVSVVKALFPEEPRAGQRGHHAGAGGAGRRPDTRRDESCRRRHRLPRRRPRRRRRRRPRAEARHAGAQTAPWPEPTMTWHRASPSSRVPTLRWRWRGNCRRAP